MGKISDYANVLKSKLTDLFVVYQRNDGELETKNATLEQLGDAICGEQVHATLETDDKTIIGGINENKDKVGSLSQLTTSDKSSLVGAVNEAYSYKSGDIITLTNFFTPCVYDANRLRAIINLPKVVRNCSFSCSYLEVYINSTDIVQTNNITNIEVQTRTPNQLWVQFTGNFTNVSNNNAGIAVISGKITFT